MRDVIVVGAGGGGAVVAKELAEHGLDVLLLEAGPRFPHPERVWSHLEGKAANPATGVLRFGPSSRAPSPWQRDLPQYSYIWQTAGCGGSTLHYFGNSPRAMPGVFADFAGDRTRYDAAHAFPFGYRELVPYYEWVEHVLPVQTAAMGTKEGHFFRGAQRIGLAHQTSKDITRDAFRPQENAILQPRGTAGRTSKRKRLVYPRAQGCTFCGYCPLGCIEPPGSPRNLRAKRSVDASYLPMALTANRWARGRAVTLATDAFATRVHTRDEGGSVRATGVSWRSTRTGATATEEAQVVVLAAGSIETPRLWLASGLPNPNDWVGRGLTDHWHDVVVGRMRTYTGTSKGPSSAARADFPGFGSFEQVGTPPALMAQVLASGASGMVGNRLKSYLSDIDRLLAIAVLTDDDVQADYRVRLSETVAPDAHGPVARVELPYRNRTPRTVRNREFLVGKAMELLRAAGARDVLRLRWAPVLLHIHGTARMGAGDADSVLDANAEARWVNRLFVADNSALPNSLGGPNPTLTTQALATRTAEKIAGGYFGIAPWVGREAPVSSVDPSVTRAVREAGV
ncbi:MAG TPA: GMC family oxidoreductase N-terminal domain-containing protein [Gaiellaceae bacterium]|nr:GMC family oxidoreductase N-terminal domain-containing protein [Gaiellaceae bacterium]